LFWLDFWESRLCHVAFGDVLKDATFHQLKVLSTMQCFAKVLKVIVMPVALCELSWDGTIIVALLEKLSEVMLKFEGDLRHFSLCHFH